MVSEIYPGQDFLGQGQMSIKVTPGHCTHAAPIMSLSSISILYLTVSEIQPGQGLSR